jgi:hypothetical protein
VVINDEVEPQLFLITIDDLGGLVPDNEMFAFDMLVVKGKPYSNVIPSIEANKNQWKSLIKTENQYRKSLVVLINDFIKILHQSGCSVRQACRASGLGRVEMAALRTRIPKFDQAYHDVFEDVTDKLEEAGIKRAVEGVKEDVYYQGEKCGDRTNYSDSILLAMLKSRRPEVYDRAHGVSPSNDDDYQDISGAVDELRQRLARMLQRNDSV